MKLSISNIGWDKSDDIVLYGHMRDMGYSGLEIAPTRLFDPPCYSKIDEAVEFSNSLKDEYGLFISSLQSIWYGVTESLFGSAEAREYLLNYTKSAIDFASAIHCKNLVFGCPKNRNISEGQDPSVAYEFFRILGEYAAEKGTVLALEANPPIYGTNFINTSQEAFKLIREVNSQGFRLNLDLGTMIYNEESVLALEENFDLVNHIHFSEPYLAPLTQRDLHNTIAHIAKEADYQGFFSIEMGKQPVTEILQIMEYVASLIR